MDFKVYLGLALSIILIFYAIFKLKTKENLSAKALILTVAISVGLIMISKILFENTIIFPIILIMGLTVNFFVITTLAWKYRKDPQKRYGSYAWLGTIVFIVLSAITIYILKYIGFFG